MTKPLESKIVDFLRSHGPQLDTEIAAALNLPLARIRSQVAALSSSGDLICCSTIRFKDGVGTAGFSCRLSCYTPPAARGRKPGGKPAAEPSAD